MAELTPTEVDVPTLDMQLKMLRLQADVLHKRIGDLINEAKKMDGQINRLSIMIDEINARVTPSSSR